MLALFLFFAGLYGLLWLVYGRGKKGRVEDRATGGFVDKWAFLRDLNTLFTRWKF